MLETSLKPSSKTKSNWHCQECGYESGGYLGRCSHCGTWGSFIKKKQITEKTQERKKPKHGIFLSPEASLLKLDEIPDTKQVRLESQSTEFNQVLGGGIVPGSITLIGGEPGIGKSTLLLQLATAFARQLRVLYVSAEESSEQIKIRARRLGLLGQPDQNLFISTENNLENLLDRIRENEPGLIIIDSIQTIYLPDLDSIPGSPTQIRECAANLMRLAKSTGIPIIMVGHITKGGDLAGPKILEHMVDTVLQFEGDRGVNIRALRSIKNRFGSTDELALFLMQENGLQDLSNPSELFLSQRAGGIVFASREGRRSLLLEIQALVLSSDYSNPRRITNGIELGRLHQILAVLEKRMGISLAKADVYCNVTGGMEIQDPAVDLAVALAIITNANPKSNSNYDKTIAVGELGLSGEIRSVTNLEARVREAAKQGFKRVICPRQDLAELTKYGQRYQIEIKAIANICDLN